MFEVMSCRFWHTYVNDVLWYACPYVSVTHCFQSLVSRMCSTVHRTRINPQNSSKLIHINPPNRKSTRVLGIISFHFIQTFDLKFVLLAEHYYLGLQTLSDARHAASRHFRRCYLKHINQVKWRDGKLDRHIMCWCCLPNIVKIS